MKKFVSKEDIIRYVSIASIAKEFEIELEEACSGSFNKRCICPSKEHKNGKERTGSLFIDTVENNFYCFGCTHGTNCIDFYMLCSDSSFSDAFNELKKRVDPSTATGAQHIPTQSNLPDLLNISNLLRKTMLAHPDDLAWINELMKNIDKYIFDINQDDVSKAKALYNKVSEELQARYG